MLAAGARRARHPVVLGLGSALWIQVTLLMTGIITARTLGPVDRGYLAVFALVPTVLVQVLSFGMPAAVTYEIASVGVQGSALVRAVARSVVVQVVLVTMLQAAAFVAFADSWPQYVAWSAAITIPFSWFVVPQLYAIAVLQGLQRPFEVSLLRALRPSLYAVSCIALLISGSATLATVTFAWIGSTAVAVAAAIATARLALTHHQGGCEPNIMRTVKFGVRAFFGTFSPLDTFRLDQGIVAWLLTPAQLGIYVVAGSLANLPTLITQAIGAVVYPAIAAAPPEGLVLRAARLFLLGLVPIVIAGLMLWLVAAPVVPLFFGDEFASAVPVARMLVIAASLAAVRKLGSDVLRGLGAPGAGSRAELASWLALAATLLALAPITESVAVSVALVLTATAALLWIIGEMLVAVRQRRALLEPVESGGFRWRR